MVYFTNGLYNRSIYRALTGTSNRATLVQVKTLRNGV